MNDTPVNAADINQETFSAVAKRMKAIVETINQLDATLEDLRSDPALQIGLLLTPRHRAIRNAPAYKAYEELRRARATLKNSVEAFLDAEEQLKAGEDY